MLRQNARTMIIAGVLLLAAVMVTFPLWRPLFVNQVVDEPLIFNAVQFADLESEQQTAYRTMADENPSMAGTMVAAALAEDTAAEEDMPEDSALTALRQGSFVQIDVIHGAEGTATLYELSDGSRFLRFEDFRVTNGPDLHVLLARADAPRNHDDLGDDYVDLGSLKGNVGSQNYAIPPEVDISQYNSVVIYCVPFQVVFSTAGLANG